MKTITATELARNLSAVLDRVAEGEEIVIERNRHPVARLLPSPKTGNALEVLGDLYRTISEEDGRAWEEDSRRGGWRDEFVSGLRDPWKS